MENIKSIFFDADDTLIDHKECERKALMYMFNNIDIEYKDEYQDVFRPLDEELWSGVPSEKHHVTKEDIPTYRFKKLFEIIDVLYEDYEKANFLFQEGLSNSSPLTEDAEDIVKYLDEKGYSMYVITNGLVRLQRPRVLNTRISKYISDVIVSEEVGAAKPDVKIFNFLIDRIRLKPNEAVMIGDSLKKDIQAAINAGIRTIWYNYGNIENKTDIIADYEINSLLELKEIL